MNLDDELRGVLLDRADDAPSDAGMLDAVRPRVRRLDRRRRFALAGAAAVTGVALAIAAPYAVAPFRVHSGVPVGAEPSPTPTPTPTLSTRVSIVSLGPPTFEPVRFPLTPTVVPPGLNPPTVGRTERVVRLVYTKGDATYLVATVGSDVEQADWTVLESQAVTVGSRAGTLDTGSDGAGRPTALLTWRLEDGAWAGVSTSGLTAAQVRAYGSGLAPEPYVAAPPLPFTLALAPIGYQVAYQEVMETGEFAFCLAPPADRDDQSSSWLCVSRMDQQAPVTQGVRVQVGPDPGDLVYSDDLIRLVVHRPGFEFSVQMHPDGALSDADLIRFAAGVTEG